MGRKQCVIIGLVFILSLSFVFPSLFAKQPMSKRLFREGKQFLEDQIAIDDKAFLDSLSSALKSASDLNLAAAEMSAVLEKNNKTTWDSVIRNVQHSGAQSLAHFAKQKSFASSIAPFDSKSSAQAFRALMARTSEIRNFYGQAKEISYYLDQSTLPEGGYHAYQIYLRAFEGTFGMQPEAILDYMTKKYARAALLARDHRIKSLREFLISDQTFLEEAQRQLTIQLITKMEITQTGWYKDLSLHVLKLINEQLSFDQTFSQLIMARLNQIPDPTVPQLPDLEILDLRLFTPPEVRIGSRLTVIADIKNAGDLKSDKTNVRLICQGNRMLRKRLPALEPGEVHTVKWRYQLKDAGMHNFHVVLNYNQRAYEENYANNEAKKSYNFTWEGERMLTDDMPVD